MTDTIVEKRLSELEEQIGELQELRHDLAEKFDLMSGLADDLRAKLKEMETPTEKEKIDQALAVARENERLKGVNLDLFFCAREYVSTIMQPWGDTFHNMTFGDFMVFYVRKKLLFLEAREGTDQEEQDEREG